MCYLYFANYARNNPGLAFLTINFLLTSRIDPVIRWLALWSLCSLRFANLVEYLVGPLLAGLKDGNGYVRLVAAMGVVKLYHISSQTCLESDFPKMLKALMLNNPDAQVVANCLSSLEEIWNLEAGFEKASREWEALLSKPVVYYLWNRRTTQKIKPYEY